MNKEAIHSFTARISQASRSEMIVILYEMALTEIGEARQAHSNGNLADFDKGLKRAQRCVSELMATLDYRYPIAYELLSLYIYTNRELIRAIYQREVQPLDSPEQVLRKLLIGFEGVSKQDTSGPVMRNSQQLYAGLTYGKGKLNETYLNPGNGNRGFIA